MRLKGIVQHDKLDCGPACLATICCFFGINVPLIKVRELAGTDLNGTTIYGLIYAANKLGLNGKAYKGTWGELYEGLSNNTICMPFIMHVIKENWHHYIVIEKMTSTFVEVFDPAEGHKKYSYSEMKNIWSGYVIMFNRKDDKCIRQDDYYKIYKTIVFDNAKLYLGTILASIIMLSITLYVSFVYRNVIDNFIFHVTNDINVIFYEMIQILIILISALMVRMCISIVRAKLLLKCERKVGEELALRFWNKILKVPLSFFESRNSGEILVRYNELMDVGYLLGIVPIYLFCEIITIIASGFFLVSINKELFLMASMIVVIYIILVLLLKKIIHKLYIMVASEYAEIIDKLKEIIDSIQIIKSFNRELHIYQKNELGIRKLFEDTFKVNKLFVLQENILFTIQNIGEICIFWAGAILVIREEVTLGSLILFINVMSILLEAIQSTVGMQKEVQSAVVSWERINDVLLAQEEMSLQNGGGYLLNNILSIEFRNISFGYGLKKYVLKDINFIINKGETVGIIGASGSGKTTIAKLLLKFYTPSCGEILINNLNVNAITNEEVRNNISFVPQDIKIFSETLRYNITNGINYVNDEVETVINICEINPIIKEQQFGLDTKIDEKCLSSGQKQRIAIGRALLRNPKVLIMDEGTSNLDNISAIRILKKIKNLYPNMIVIHIVHRLEILKQCDQILWLKNGAILSGGNHETFIKNNEEYRKLWMINNNRMIHDSE